MDVVFHAASAGVLAYGLGERRPKQLLLAGVVGAVPDALWAIAYFHPEYRDCYSALHSLVFNVILCAVLCYFNWRIAFGAWLHVFVDVFTHSSTTYHLLYPFAKFKLFNGVDWWRWPGLALWGSLWLVLLALIFRIWRSQKGFTKKRIEIKGVSDEEKK